MPDPQTSNIKIYQPTRGSDSGTWDLPVNANSGALDSLFGNVATIGLTNAPVTLTTPPTSGAAWSGPYQSQSGILKFTGTLTADVTVTLPRAGFFIVQNKCTVGAFAVILASAAPGNVIGVPPGEAIHVICDGTNVDFVALGRINEYEDWAVSSMPRWNAVCTVPPYLLCNGSGFSAVTYPNTAAYLGGTLTPDGRGRVRFALNGGITRITSSAGYGIDGNTILAAGGSQSLAVPQLPTFTPGFSIQPVYNFTDVGQTVGAALGGGATVVTFLRSTPTAITNAAFDPIGNGANALPPGYVGGITVLRAG